MDTQTSLQPKPPCAASRTTHHHTLARSSLASAMCDGWALHGPSGDGGAGRRAAVYVYVRNIIFVVRAHSGSRRVADAVPVDQLAFLGAFPVADAPTLRVVGTCAFVLAVLLGLDVADGCNARALRRRPKICTPLLKPDVLGRHFFFLGHERVGGASRAGVVRRGAAGARPKIARAAARLGRLGFAREKRRVVAVVHARYVAGGPNLAPWDACVRVCRSCAPLKALQVARAVAVDVTVALARREPLRVSAVAFVT